MKILRRRLTYRSIVIVLVLLAISGACSGQEDPNSLRGFEKEITDALREAQVFPEVPAVIDLPGKRPLLLARILSQDIDSFLDIDEQRVQQHFQGLDESVLNRILRKWNLPSLDLDEYISIPFYVESKPGEGRKPVEVRFVVSDKILGAPISSRLYYTSLLRAYSALPSDLKTNPSGWSHGLCSLIAQDFSYRSSLAACPDLEVETAIAALLFDKNENVLWDAFPSEEKRFDSSAYNAGLRTSISAVGSESPSEALTELLRSPEEYNVLFQGQKQQAKEQKAKDPQALGYVPPISPAMRILWMILPSTESALRSTADYVSNNINHAGLRFVLINACYDKLCSVIGHAKAGMVTDSSLLLNAILEGHFEQTGYHTKQLLQDFDNRMEQVWRQFEEELQRREQTEEKLEVMAYDPSILKWAFRFFYNYSLPIRQAQKEFRDKIRKEGPQISQDKIDKIFSESVTPEVILSWWRADPYVRKLLDTVGNPNLEVRPSRFSRTGIELDCRWNLRRKGTEDIEQVEIQIIDPASSGGGKPQPGVSPEAKVVVRKTLNDEPQVIKLKDIEPGFYVQTVNDLDAEDKMREDWARVVTISMTPPTSPWKIDSGAAEALEIGRKQPVRVRTKESGPWQWMLPLPLRPDRDSLLGITQEGPVEHGEVAKFFAADVKESTPLDKSIQLILITLSHAEVEAIKKSGIGTWGYFANARFVMAQVYPAPGGVDGKAKVELPSGHKPIDTLQKASLDNPGDKVNAFDYGSNHTFVDHVRNIDSKPVNYFVKLTYNLPDGNTNSICVAEGQRLVVCEPASNRVLLKRAYQLDRKHKLVSGFNTDGSPQKAVITSIEGHDGQLGAYKLQLRQCPLVRANGILIPVVTEPSFVCSGVAEDSLVQLSPPLPTVRQATAQQIDLSGAAHVQAKDVSTSDLILSYNFRFEPRSFWQTNIARIEESTNNRYIKIMTGPATLSCGHLQEIYVTKEGWSGLRPVQASTVRAGDQVVWLCASGRNAEGASATVAQDEILRAAERANLRLKSGISSTVTGAKPGSLHLVTVQKVEEMHPTETTPYVSFREFIASDTNLLRMGLRPNMFANGILVRMRVAPVERQGEDLGGLGPNRGKSKVSREPGPGPYQPAIGGIIRDVDIKMPPIAYNNEDLEQFRRNREQLESAFAAFTGGKTQLGAIRREVMQRFLKHYFNGIRDLNQFYRTEHLTQYFHNYLEARDFLISTGNWRVLPGVVNGYVFVATLTYEAGAREFGDALTRDWLCIAARTINKRKHFYGTSTFRIRGGLAVTRDILLYIREKSEKDGFEPVTKVEFSTESFDNTLKEYFIKKEGFSDDICSEKKVNMYNFCRQLERWSANASSIPKSIVAPGFRSSQLFSGRAFGMSLGITKK